MTLAILTGGREAKKLRFSDLYLPYFCVKIGYIYAIVFVDCRRWVTLDGLFVGRGAVMV